MMGHANENKLLALRLCALTLFGGAAMAVSCGQFSGGSQGASSTQGDSQFKLESREFTSKDPSGSNANGLNPSASGEEPVVVWAPPPEVTPPPAWEPAEAYVGFKNHCFECHYQFRYKDSVIASRVKIEASIRATSGTTPMPPIGRTPNHTTFRNTADGQAILAWLTSIASTSAPMTTATPIATATPALTPTPSDSVFKWEGVNGQVPVREIVQRSCVEGCHVTGGQASFALLGTLPDFKSHASDSKFQVEFGYMPKSPRTISTQEKAILLDYLRYSAELR